MVSMFVICQLKSTASPTSYIEYNVINNLFYIVYGVVYNTVCWDIEYYYGAWQSWAEDVL